MVENKSRCDQGEVHVMRKMEEVAVGVPMGTTEELCGRLGCWGGTRTDSGRGAATFGERSLGWSNGDCLVLCDDDDYWRT